jgi:AraC family transcriptional regulator
MEIRSKKIESMHIATISHVGPYGGSSRLYQEIMEWLRQKRLKIVGPPLGWFYDNPEEVPAHKLRSDVGVPFEGEAKPEGKIKIKKTSLQEVLCTVHKGPYREVGPAYTALFQHAREKGYVPLGCPMEIYLNDPAKVEENDLLTEVQLPIKKR